MTREEANEYFQALDLLEEALRYITDKPWDDNNSLHYRISRYLGLPVSYPDWNYEGDKDER